MPYAGRTEPWKTSCYSRFHFQSRRRAITSIHTPTTNPTKSVGSCTSRIKEMGVGRRAETTRADPTQRSRNRIVVTLHRACAGLEGAFHRRPLSFYLRFNSLKNESCPGFMRLICGYGFSPRLRMYSRACSNLDVSVGHESCCVFGEERHQFDEIFFIKVFNADSVGCCDWDVTAMFAVSLVACINLPLGPRNRRLSVLLVCIGEFLLD